ncbi:hypothetical protein [Psychrobacter urativorans]|uniref:Uncharacterized protein n=1 Tax=Psychrobacter urativorans TaxID=45610 RepID=A0A0M4TV52_9GAMM|nr:hypothetical protein [Psychrobacter urativorans]ALF59624.1 hypothetical protein AOC03_05780 [Psychrobacter urativorans]
MIEPFANNHQSMQIGDLVIENQTDKITIYGDIDLKRDVVGKQQAQQLHELTSKILQAFDNYPENSKNLAESKDNNDSADETIDNPFL